MTKWQTTGAMGSTNHILKFDDFYISYNPDPGACVFGTFGSDDGGAETALCHGGKFHILNGDYREQYEKLAAEGAFDACKKFYDQQSAHADSSWSSR